MELVLGRLEALTLRLQPMLPRLIHAPDRLKRLLLRTKHPTNRLILDPISLKQVPTSPIPGQVTTEEWNGMS